MKTSPMQQDRALTGARLKTPRAAAIAGILFSVLLIAVFSLLRLSVPADPQEAGLWLSSEAGTVRLALNLVPVGGVAFLWFIGVLRDRVGQQEDRFFATVFLGSGLLFLAMLFMAAATIAAMVTAFAEKPELLANSDAFQFARAAVFNIANNYMVKVAGVFMISTSTVAVYTRFAPRWMAFLGYGLALVLFFGGDYFSWGFVGFPLWVLLLSVHILLDNLRRPDPAAGDDPK